MLQGWHDLASVHWPYEPAVVQRLLPAGYEVDTHDGMAWVGLIPFLMHRVRLPALPALGPLSTFPETNIRTYIVGPDGRRGVWFASLDVTRLLPALVACGSYRLPYCWSRMSISRTGDEIEYRSRRRWPQRGPASHLRLRIGAPIPPAEVSDLDHFLTARWALGSTIGTRLLWAEVDHEPWPLHRAEVITVSETLIGAAGLPRPSGDPHALWSPGVEVRIGRPHLVGPRSGRPLQSE
jgi:uncharacterized protein YqjF (DUF2071 family)